MNEDAKSQEYTSIFGYFDEDYYLHHNPDVAQAGANPLRHFMESGWREGRNPSAHFSVAYYLKIYPDVLASGMNPLLHYALAGRAEGRRARRAMDAERTVVEEAQSPLPWLAGAQDCGQKRPVFSQWSMLELLRSALNDKLSLVLSFSHDDYNSNLGGVQNLIREERREFESMSFCYLHLFPAVSNVYLQEERESNAIYNFTLEGGYGASVSASDLEAALLSLHRENLRIFTIIHHLMRNSPESVARICSIDPDRVIVWVHDFFTVCPNPNLLRNDIRFCGGPRVESAACNVCVYGKDRAALRERVKSFFKAIVPWVLAPSESALRHWLETSDLPCRGADVQSLARLALDGGSATWSTDPSRRIRIAHAGARTPAKGWLTFQSLVDRFRQDDRYEFHQLGVMGGRSVPGVSHWPVRVTPEAPEAMVEALVEKQVDVVVSWSPWPETFCYAAYEAIAAGTFVLTHQGAGNVTAIISSQVPEQGLVLPDEAALFSLLEQGLGDVLRGRRRRRGTLIREGGTAAWLTRTAHGSKLLHEVFRSARAPAVELSNASEGANV